MATVKIFQEKNKVGFLKRADYPIVEIQSPKKSVDIIEVLPFRIRFTNIGIPSYLPPNIAPIGIAIVGFNNYIL